MTFCKDLRATALASKSFFKDKLSNNTTMNAMFAIGIKKKTVLEHWFHHQ